jgi:hypothetical protein
MRRRVMIKNPWDEMSIGSKRRASMQHEIFWIREEIRGEYGLKITLKKKSAKNINVEDIKFRNVEFLKAQRMEDEVEWYLLLKENEEWEIFYKLCSDLIEQVDNIQKEETMLVIVVNRLKRWQKLLAHSVSNQLTPETQMGLFSELHTLYNYISKISTLREAVNSWGGPEADIQDFIIYDKAFEVKSHRSNRSEFITISNPYQLYSVKEKFYLIVYALSKSENGKTISDMANIIKSKLEQETLIYELDMLDQKIGQYGYYDLIHKDHLIKFNIDKISLFEIRNDFPRISINNIPEGVENLKYQIDTTKCEKFEVSLDACFLKEVN